MARDPDAVIRDLYDLLESAQGDVVRERLRGLLGLPSRNPAEPVIIAGEVMPRPDGWPIWGDRWLDNFRKTGVILYACQAARITRPTYRRVTRLGSPGYCRAFVEAVSDAEDEVTDVFVGKLYELALAGNFKAIIAILRTKRRSEWGVVRRTEITGAEGGPVEHNHVHALREQVRRRLLPEPGPGSEDPVSGQPDG